MILSTLLENEGIQGYLTTKEDSIMEGAKTFHEYPQVIKDHILENLDQFVVPGDIKATYTRMVSFVESSVSQILSELSMQIVESEAAAAAAE